MMLLFCTIMEEDSDKLFISLSNLEFSEHVTSDS